MCAAEQIILLADEVYQDNIYVEHKSFQSFKKVAVELGLLGSFPLISFNSISKGAVGECGRRGGYMEITGVDEEVRDQFLKLASINLCPNVGGQMCTALVRARALAGERRGRAGRAEGPVRGFRACGRWAERLAVLL